MSESRAQEWSPEQRRALTVYRVAESAYQGVAKMGGPPDVLAETLSALKNYSDRALQDLERAPGPDLSGRGIWTIPADVVKDQTEALGLRSESNE